MLDLSGFKVRKKTKTKVVACKIFEIENGSNVAKVTNTNEAGMTRWKYDWKNTDFDFANKLCQIC